MKLFNRDTPVRQHIFSSYHWSTALIFIGLIGLVITQPYILTSLLITIIGSVVWKLPLKLLGLKFPTWQVTLAVATASVIICSSQLPAQAIMFDAIQEQIKNIAGDSIPADAVDNIFTFFRIIILLAIIIGSIYGVTQGLQGQDWRPIAQILGIGVAFIIGIDVLTSLVLGDGTTTSSPGNNTPGNTTN